VRTWLPLYVLCALTLLLWSLSIDLSAPGTYAELDARAAGFPGNANFSALVTVMLCAATLDFQRRRRGWLDLVLLTVTTTIVLGTMSRSGLINLGVLMIVYFYYRLLASPGAASEALRLCAALLAIATTLLVVVPLFTHSMPALKQSSRISRFLNNQQVDDGSAGTRLAAVKDSLRRIDAAPLLGHGTGHARSMPELPHNLYLQQWVNNGLPGVLSYLALLGLSYTTFRRRGDRNGVAFIIVTTVGSAFSHNVLDQRPFLMLLGILLGSCSEERSPPYPRPATER
jgi:O-antigen ligase